MICILRLKAVWNSYNYLIWKSILFLFPCRKWSVMEESKGKSLSVIIQLLCLLQITFKNSHTIGLVNTEDMEKSNKPQIRTIPSYAVKIKFLIVYVCQMYWVLFVESMSIYNIKLKWNRKLHVVCRQAIRENKLLHIEFQVLWILEYQIKSNHTFQYHTSFIFVSILPISLNSCEWVKN